MLGNSTINDSHATGSHQPVTPLKQTAVVETDGKTSQTASEKTASIYKFALCAPAPLPGDHSVSDPPDPIPNSTVKPDRADGTIAQALEE